MTFQELVQCLQKLNLPKDFSYLPSSTSSDTNTYTLIVVSENEIKANRDGNEVSVSITQIHSILDHLREYIPLDVEKTLGGSGNTRSIIESLFCLTPSIFHTRINNRKHIVYIPTKSHDIGVLSSISEIELKVLLSEYKKTVRSKIKGEFEYYLTKIATSKRSGKNFTPSAISSYLLFTSVDKLFDYNPEKWRHIESLFDITSIDKITNIINVLKNDKNFIIRNRNDNNGWRLGAINQYLDFLLSKKNVTVEEPRVIDNQEIDNASPSLVSNFNFGNFQSCDRYVDSLLAKPFVILAGNSGTGKTRIAIRFARYLEKKNDSGLTNHLLIPVGADWTDNTKVLGFYNPLADNGAGKYEKTDIFKFIELAGANPEIPFFLILDEMNLSHVERYFSDFLSKMELLNYSKPDDKVYFDITGYGKLEFPKNLFITGTVNIDETTYMFSPKVLDRANVIEFKPGMEDVLNNLFAGVDEGVSAGEKNETAEPGEAEGFMLLANEVRFGVIPPEVLPVLNDIKVILESFYKELEKYGFEFAYRTVKEIRLYAIAAYKTAEDKKPEAKEIADIQILQKILPKIHGNKKQIGSLLDELEKLCVEKKLENSLVKIQQMKDKLNRFQYASFI